jgi:hypothetical protein
MAFPLDNLDLTRVADKAEQWEKVVRKLRGGMMPPSGEARPDFATLETLTSWIENEIDRHPALELPAPGLHRLNRTEYSNVIRDLLSLDVDATKFLPPDDSTRGFDNMAAALGLSPALLEAYLSAAGKISRLARPSAGMERHSRCPIQENGPPHCPLGRPARCGRHVDVPLPYSRSCRRRPDGDGRARTAPSSFG